MDAGQQEQLNAASSYGSVRPTTSSRGQRPMTGRPTTSGSNLDARPMTRGGPRAGNDGNVLHEEARAYGSDEDYEAESEDEDVFAFLPPDLGPAPDVVRSSDPQPFGQLPPQAVETVAHQQDEAYYLDEATGAVYDAQGRLVQMSNDQQLQSQQSVHGQALDRTETVPPGYPPVNRPSLDRKSSISSGMHDHGRHNLTHAQSFNAYPHAMDPLDAVEHLNSRDGPRRTSAAFDNASLSSSFRQRHSRPSHGADGPDTPNSELKFNFDNGSSTYPDKLTRYSSELGQEGGMAGFDGGTAAPVVGPRGIKMVELELEGDEDSPYPEVRASVSNLDDIDMPANTVRMWILALLLTTIGAGINAVLSLRYPAPTLTALIAQVISYPIGKLLAAILPLHTWTLPKWLGGREWSLNPGMFNIKEHTAIVMMANVGILTAYSINTVLVQNGVYYYDRPKPIGFSVLLTLSSQLIGMGMAGATRRFLVSPASMIWPQVLVISTVFNTLHAEEDGMDGSMSRFRYYALLSSAAFVFWWFPGWIFTALSAFSFVCWIWPQSFAVNTLFGTVSGMGMSVLTFDWQVISYLTSPLVTPWWAQCNIFAGFVVFLWLIAPLLYWNNVYNFGYLPFSSSSSYDRFGETYNVNRVVSAENTLDELAYEGYSQLYFGTTYYIVYWTGFATFTSVLVHTVLYHGTSIWRGVRGIKTEEDDVHAKMMRRYKDVPDWWYGVVFVGSFVLAIICAEVYDTELPIWALVISVLIPVVYYLPSGFIYAQTGNTIGVNLVSEFIIGYALPGKALPNMMVKLYSQVGLTQGLTFSQDLKLGHYMKIDPRLTFAVMLVGGIWSSIVHVFVTLFMQSRVTDICSPDQGHAFICPQAAVYYTSSIIWGVIGPERMFSQGSYYSSVYWAMLVGCVAPIPVFFAARRWPGRFLRTINVPLFFTGTSAVPPASGIVVSSWFFVGFIFQYVIRKRRFAWWSKYNFITSAAMDTGTILSAIAVFLVLILPRDGTIALHWWGNDVIGNTLDGNPGARLATPADGFAPAPSIVHASSS